MAYLIKHNDPSVGYVSWQNLNMQYNGSSYAIANGNTNKVYTWWELSDPLKLKSSNEYPSLSAADALVLLNKNGTAMLVPGATILDGALIVPGTILAEALSANSVTGEKILAGEIDTAHLAAGAITSDTIAAGAIGAAAIAAGAISADHLSAGAVTADKIVSNAVTAAKIAANAVTANKIAANAVTADKIAANAVTATKINVSDLSAIAGTFTSLMTGTVGGARLHMGQSGGKPYIEAYDDTELRFIIKENKIEFWANGRQAGHVWATILDSAHAPIPGIDIVAGSGRYMRLECPDNPISLRAPNVDISVMHGLIGEGEARLTSELNRNMSFETWGPGPAGPSDGRLYTRVLIEEDDLKVNGRVYVGGMQHEAVFFGSYEEW